MNKRAPLLANLRVQGITDAEIRQIARDAAREAERMIRNTSGIRALQIKLANQQVQMWQSVLDHTKVGIGDATDAAATVHSMFEEELFRKAGITSEWWRMSMLEQARSGIDNVIARKENGITLSQRVYRNSALSSGKIDRTLNAGIALGKSAREIAKDVYEFISPDVPGGASYAAMRLARTELNNAFHTASVNACKNNPFVDMVQWNLSGSHSRPDECNEYAGQSHVPGINEAGYFLVADVPAKPHPNCLCYTIPVLIDEEQLIKGFKNGEYDDYIDGVMGCSRVG